MELNFIFWSTVVLLTIFAPSTIYLSIGMFLSITFGSIILGSLSSWFGVIFFLVYCSGLLILIFYVAVLDLNSVSKIELIKFAVMIFLFIIFFPFFVTKFDNENNLKFEGYCFNIYFLNYSEGSLIIFRTSILFFLIWLVVKLLYFKVGNMRLFL